MFWEIMLKYVGHIISFLCLLSMVIITYLKVKSDERKEHKDYSDAVNITTAILLLNIVFNFLTVVMEFIN